MASVLITGALREIGRGMVEELTDRGCATHGASNCVEAWVGFRSNPVSVGEVAKAVALAIEDTNSAFRNPIGDPANSPAGLLSSRLAGQVQPSAVRRPAPVELRRHTRSAVARG